MAPAAFKAVGTSDPRSAGSIPVRLRQQLPRSHYRRPKAVDNLRPVKKLLLLIILVSLGAIAAKKLREA